MILGKQTSAFLDRYRQSPSAQVVAIDGVQLETPTSRRDLGLIATPQTRVSGITAGGGGVSSQIWSQIKSILMGYGLTSTQANKAVELWQNAGKVPTPTDIERYARAFGIDTQAESIPEVDQAIENATNAPVYEMNTGFSVSDPMRDTQEESFFQQNKNWLIPVGAVVVVGGVYLLTRKK